MQIRLYLRMLQRGWWIVALTALAALNIALVSTYIATPQYRASARLIVSPDTALTTGRDLINSLEALDKRSIVSTYAEMLSSERIYQETAAALQIDPAALEEYQLSTVVLPEANILEMSVEGPNPQITARLANAVSQRAIDELTTLYQVYEVNFLDPAQIPIDPFSPMPVRDTSLALVLGLALGAVLAILREQVIIPLETLRRHLRVDAVSMAYTRRYLQRRIAEMCAQNPDGVMSLGLIQLDGLGDLMETLPQPVIQRLLRYTANTLQSELKGSDIVGRWSDNSFAVLLPATPRAGAKPAFERIRRVLTKPVELEEERETIYLNPYTGVAVREAGESFDTVVEYAESALRFARQNNLPVSLHTKT